MLFRSTEFCCGRAKGDVSFEGLEFVRRGGHEVATVWGEVYEKEDCSVVELGLSDEDTLSLWGVCDSVSRGFKAERKGQGCVVESEFVDALCFAGGKEWEGMSVFETGGREIANKILRVLRAGLKYGSELRECLEMLQDGAVTCGDFYRVIQLYMERRKGNFEIESVRNCYELDYEAHCARIF